MDHRDLTDIERAVVEVFKPFGFVTCFASDLDMDKHMLILSRNGASICFRDGVLCVRVWRGREGAKVLVREVELSDPGVFELVELWVGSL